MATTDMTRIETALAAMDHEVAHKDGSECAEPESHDRRARRRAATPTGQALAALVEEATSYITSDPRTGSWDGLVHAVHRFRTATEVQP